MTKRDRKSAEKRKRNMLIFVGVVAFTMIFSAFYYTGSQDKTGSTNGQETTKPLFNQYKVQLIGNSSMLMQIKSKTNDLIVMFNPQKLLTQDMIRLFLNMSNSSVPEIAYSSCDSTDKYLLCTVNFKGENLSKLNERLDDIFGSYYLKRAFLGNLQQPFSTLFGVNETYLVGNLNDAEGEYIKVWLYQKDFGGFTGFEEKKVPQSESIPATVLNVSNYLFSGTVAGELYIENLSVELKTNSSEMEISLPRVSINSKADNATLSELNSLEGVSAIIEENLTIVNFNHSISRIREVLSRKNLTYTQENGTLSFTVQLDRDITQVKETLNRYGIKEVITEKQGIVSFTEEVLSQGRLVRVSGSDSFVATLNERTKSGEKINVSLSLIFFGNQIIPLGVKQI